MYVSEFKICNVIHTHYFFNSTNWCTWQDRSRSEKPKPEKPRLVRRKASASSDKAVAGGAGVWSAMSQGIKPGTEWQAVWGFAEDFWGEGRCGRRWGLLESHGKFTVWSKHNPFNPMVFDSSHSDFPVSPVWTLWVVTTVSPSGTSPGVHGLALTKILHSAQGNHRRIVPTPRSLAICTKRKMVCVLTTLKVIL